MYTIDSKYKDSIKICFSCDNNYAKYLAVTIKSIIENANKNYNYEIYIFDENIFEYNKNKILNMSINNIYIYFININKYIEDIDKNIFYIRDFYSISTYYRFFIPRIFNEFDRVLYLDCDIAVLDDLVKLFYSKQLDNYLMLVVSDSYFQMDTIDEYSYQSKIKLKNPDNYFQAGVLLFNIKKCIDFDFEIKNFNKLKEIKTPLLVDQDILNIVCENNVGYLDLSYNVEWFIPIQFNLANINVGNKKKEEYKKSYINSYNNPKILHYCSAFRPWKNPELDKASIWWQYAKQTPFYEEIIYQNTNIQNIKNIKNISDTRFSIADFIFSVTKTEKYKIFTILGIKFTIKNK